MNKKLIRLSKSCIGENEIAAVEKVLQNEFLGMGKEVEKFEEELNNFFNRPVVCTVNGTAALQLALQACQIGLGDEVLVPSLTYIASFQAISATGATPIACDIDSQEFLLSIESAKKNITDKTRAIMPVHYSGGVGDLESLYNFANDNNLRVIEDAAHAFGTIYNDKKIGSFGDIACFSFDGIKNITSGEGGCLVTNDQKVLKRARDARLLGVEKDTEKRFKGKRSWDFDVSSQGWRYHMSNLMAAIGIEQLKQFEEFAMKRKKLSIHYNKLFQNNKNILPLKRDYSNVVPHIYVVRIPGMKNRQELKDLMLNYGIEVGYHYKPNHYLSFFKNNKVFPVTDKVFQELLTLPLHPDLSKSDIEYVSEKLINSIK